MLETQKPFHRLGETIKTQNLPEINECTVDIFGGCVHIEWEPQAPVTPIGQLPFFIEFLKQGNLFKQWIKACPLKLTSPNAPSNRDILGTILLSILSGHTRYSHIKRLQGDSVNPPLLGMNKIVSEDAIRRAMIKLEEISGQKWLQNNLNYCCEPLLREPWILDVDMTVKVIYGKQEGAVVGYNPQKPGRPSHAYHTYMMSPLRLILSVEVQPGNQHTAKHTAPELWNYLRELPKDCWPAFIRGDCNFGSNNFMREAEENELAYLFKIRCTKNIRKLIEKLMRNLDWEYAGQGWEGIESQLQLEGWSQKRRVIVLRKKIQQEIAVTCEIAQGQEEFIFADVNQKMQVYEYAVLATSLPDEILTIAQHYRDRADSENVFDELKNQWGWCGFTTHDFKRSKIMARMIALIYNWWSLFVKLAEPNKHLEAITSRPLLLNAVGCQIQHGRQKRISISHHHAKSSIIKKALIRINGFFKKLKQATEQLSEIKRWYYILSQVFVKYLRGSLLHPPNLLIQNC